MANVVCPQCGAPLDPGAMACKFCGEKIVAQQVNQQMNQQVNQQVYSQYPQMNQQMYQQVNPQQYQYGGPQPQATYVVQQPQAVYVTAIDPRWPIKSKVAAGILGIFLGGIGVHKFYLGKIGTGLVYLLFCWTGIPAVVGFIEGIMYLCSNDENFQLKNHVRIG